tara:strand:- start:1214 stop:2431 length:1218 start_codon:yes stop_codon:yes gene_type:complete
MVKVILRVKPIPPNRTNCLRKISNKKVMIERNRKDYLYNVDMIYERVENKKLFYNLYDTSLIKSNVLIAYGQSGSGKTYSIFGNEDTNGILTYLCRQMFAKYAEYYITCYEIYNNVMYDLLDKEQKLKYYSFSNFIDKRKKYIINDVSDYLGIIDLIQRRRKKSFTSMNSRSSRSHCVIEIMRGELKYTLIDLAGSEQKRYDKEKSTSDQHERKTINKDLFAIKEIIRTQNSKKIGNYHSSKIACVIKHAFKSSKSINILCTVIPTKKYAYDSIDSLGYCTLLTKPLSKETSIIKYKSDKDKMESNVTIKINRKEFPPVRVNKNLEMLDDLPKFLEPILKLKVNEKLDIHKPSSHAMIEDSKEDFEEFEDEPPPLVDANEEKVEEKKKKPVPRVRYNFETLDYRY